MRNWDDESEVETLVMVQEAFTAGGAEPTIAPVAPVAVEPLGEIPAIIWDADAATLAFRSVRGDLDRLLGFSAAHWTGSPKFFEERIHPEDRVRGSGLLSRGNGLGARAMRARSIAR